MIEEHGRDLVVQSRFQTVLECVYDGAFIMIVLLCKFYKQNPCIFKANIDYFSLSNHIKELAK